MIEWVKCKCEHFIFISAHFIIKGNAFYAYFLSFHRNTRRIHRRTFCACFQKESKKKSIYFVVALLFYYQNDLEFARKWHVKNLFYCRAGSSSREPQRWNEFYLILLYVCKRSHLLSLFTYYYFAYRGAELNRQ